MNVGANKCFTYTINFIKEYCIFNRACVLITSLKNATCRIFFTTYICIYLSIYLKISFFYTFDFVPLHDFKFVL